MLHHPNMLLFICFFRNHAVQAPNWPMSAKRTPCIESAVSCNDSPDCESLMPVATITLRSPVIMPIREEWIPILTSLVWHGRNRNQIHSVSPADTQKNYSANEMVSSKCSFRIYSLIYTSKLRIACLYVSGRIPRKTMSWVFCKLTTMVLLVELLA